MNSQEINWACEGQQKKENADHELEISAWFHSFLAQPPDVRFVYIIMVLEMFTI